MRSGGMADILRAPLRWIVILVMIAIATGVVTSFAFVAQQPRGLRALTVAFFLSAAIGLFGLLRDRAWAPWPLLTAIGFAATIACCAWALGVDQPLAGVLALACAIGAVAMFVIGTPSTRDVGLLPRILFGTVLLFAAWV